MNALTLAFEHLAFRIEGMTVEATKKAKEAQKR
jgi:hypothetical protein